MNKKLVLCDDEDLKDDDFVIHEEIQWQEKLIQDVYMTFDGKEFQRDTEYQTTEDKGTPECMRCSEEILDFAKYEREIEKIRYEEARDDRDN